MAEEGRFATRRQRREAELRLQEQNWEQRSRARSAPETAPPMPSSSPETSPAPVGAPAPPTVQPAPPQPSRPATEPDATAGASRRETGSVPQKPASPPSAIGPTPETPASTALAPQKAPAPQDAQRQVPAPQDAAALQETPAPRETPVSREAPMTETAPVRTVPATDDAPASGAGEPTEAMPVFATRAERRAWLRARQAEQAQQAERAQQLTGDHDQDHAQPSQPQQAPQAPDATAAPALPVIPPAPTSLPGQPPKSVREDAGPSSVPEHLPEPSGQANPEHSPEPGSRPDAVAAPADALDVALPSGPGGEPAGPATSEDVSPLERAAQPDVLRRRRESGTQDASAATLSRRARRAAERRRKDGEDSLEGLIGASAVQDALARHQSPKPESFSLKGTALDTGPRTESPGTGASEPGAPPSRRSRRKAPVVTPPSTAGIGVVSGAIDIGEMQASTGSLRVHDDSEHDASELRNPPAPPVAARRSEPLDESLAVGRTGSRVPVYALGAFVLIAIGFGIAALFML